MHDNFSRTIDYLRVSVTDRCNFRCVYCMPSEGVKILEHGEVLSYEEMLRIISVFGKCGIRKVRLTGGEPLVRKGIVEFVRSLRGLEEITDLSMTTNGSLLSGFAHDIKAAGLNRVNISLDTVNPHRFNDITRCGSLKDTLAGIESAIAVGLAPVKINVVLTEAFTQDDLAYFVEQTYNYPVFVRFIEYMPIGKCGIGPGLSIQEVKELLDRAGFGALEQAAAACAGNGPAKYYHLPKSTGMFGFITPISEHFCSTCNRLRLTADGKLKPCLLSNQEFDIKAALRSGASDDILAEIFYQAVRAKPASHSLCRSSGHSDFTRKMSQIGG